MKIYNRRSVRLKEYDYSQEGFYFVTICAFQFKPRFGHMQNEIMVLNELGKIVESAWNSLPQYFPQIEMDEHVIMPNHFHGIICITEKTSDSECKHGTSQTIGSMVRCFKAKVTSWARKNTSIESVWQRNYYEHIIRDDKDYFRILEYIENNPLKSELDKLGLW